MRKRKSLIKTLIIVVAAATPLLLVDWRECLATSKLADMYMILIVFATIQIDRVFMTYKWTILLRKSGVSISIKTALKAYYIGSFWAAFLPSSIGGDVVRVKWLMKETSDRAYIISSIIVERFIGALAQAFIALISFILLTEYMNLKVPFLSRIIYPLLLLSAVGVVMLFSRTSHKIIYGIVCHIPSRRLHESIQKVSNSLMAFRARPGLLVSFLILSTCEQVFPIISTFAMAKAFLVDLSLIWAVITVPIILAISRMPISINSFGVRESAYALILSFAGVTVSQSVVMSLVDRVLLLVATLPGALWMILPSGGHFPEPVISRPADPAEG